MRRTIFRFAKSVPSQDRRFERGGLANEGARALGVNRPPIIAVLSQEKCILLTIHRAYSSRESGVALRAGLLAALKPRKRVFPLAGCHP
jgi:hypothetical protein